MPAMNADIDVNGRAMAAAGAAARDSAAVLALSPAAQRDAALLAAADSLTVSIKELLAANARDLELFTGTPAFLDRLRLDEGRIAFMAQGLRDVAALPDPLARTLAEWTRPNGLRISRVAQPIGVLGMIYESRPNVGADAAALAIKSGNAILLRGGSESFFSAQAIQRAIETGLRAAGLPEACVQIAPTTDRGFVGAMLAASAFIDLMIPRGGKSLVERVRRDARMPVLAHAEGLNHVYVHAGADFAMARRIVVNSKLRRTGVCGAAETLLVDRAIAEAFLPAMIGELAALGCTFRADARSRAIMPSLPAAEPEDFDTEWLDAVLNIAVIDGVDAALAHITAHGSAHTDAIITEDVSVAEYFLERIDSAVALWNASTQFCDGGEFGFGAEIGIATGRVQARGPVGPEQLTTFRYVLRGSGQIRPV